MYELLMRVVSSPGYIVYNMYDSILAKNFLSQNQDVTADNPLTQLAMAPAVTKVRCFKKWQSRIRLKCTLAQNIHTVFSEEVGHASSYVICHVGLYPLVRYGVHLLDHFFSPLSMESHTSIEH